MPPEQRSHQRAGATAHAATLHPECVVCTMDRDSLGHWIGEGRAPFDVEDLVAHLMRCSEQLPLFADEVEPF